MSYQDDDQAEEIAYQAELDRLELVHREVSLKGPWKIEPHNNGIVKHFAITNEDNEELTLYVDYDDVDHITVDKAAANLVNMLNVEVYLRTFEPIERTES